MAREPYQPAGQPTARAAERSSSMTDRLRGGVEECCETTESAVRDNPMTSVALAFGVGMGVGLVIGTAIAGSTQETWRSRGAAEKFGRQMVDAISGWMPESVARRMPGQ